MSDLIAWLRAQLDDDERRTIARRDGHPGPCLNYPGQDPEDHDPYDACYLHLHDVEATPYRDVEFGLAEVDAKRKILDEYEAAFTRRKDHPGDLPLAGAILTMVRVVKLLAQPYAGRDGWREEWRA